MIPVKIGFIVAAAGLSRRHPPNKLLIPIQDKPVIRRTIESLLPLNLPVVAVLGHQADKVREVLRNLDSPFLQMVENDDFGKGMASSLSVGIRALPTDLDYFGFLPGDKPFISTSTIQKMVDFLSLRRPLILVPEYKTKPGHPTFFATSLRSEFLQLTGDTGGREIIAAHLGSVTSLAMDDPNIIVDMDSWLENQGE